MPPNKINFIFFIYIYFFVIIYNCGCGYPEVKKITKNYYLVAIDILENESFCYSDNDGSFGFTLIKPTVFSVGYNKNYFFLKQHPFIDSVHLVNKKITNYYIIPKIDTINFIKNPYNDSIFKPMNEEEFNIKLKKLNIENKNLFTINIKELE